MQLIQSLRSDKEVLILKAIASLSMSTPYRRPFHQQATPFLKETTLSTDKRLFYRLRCCAASYTHSAAAKHFYFCFKGTARMAADCKPKYVAKTSDSQKEQVTPLSTPYREQGDSIHSIGIRNERLPKISMIMADIYCV